jgi:hypothetical protein
LADTEAAPDLQAVLIGSVLMLVLFEPEMDTGATSRVLSHDW